MRSVARHLHEDARRHFTTVYATSMDPFDEGRDEIQSFDRAGEATGDVLPTQIGAVKGNCVKGSADSIGT